MAVTPGSPFSASLGVGAIEKMARAKPELLAVDELPALVLLSIDQLTVLEVTLGAFFGCAILAALPQDVLLTV